MKKHTAEHKRNDFRIFHDLSAESIDSAVRMVGAALTEHGIDFEQRDRLKLLLEKTLSAYAKIDARAVSAATQHTYELLLSAERIYQLLNSRDFAKEEWGEETLDTVRGEIEMRDVHFSYRHENDVLVPVLKGVDCISCRANRSRLWGEADAGQNVDHGRPQAVYGHQLRSPVLPGGREGACRRITSRASGKLRSVSQALRGRRHRGRGAEKTTTDVAF